MVEKEEFYRDLGGLLRDIRYERELTQQEMAESLGVSLRAYQTYEHGKAAMPAFVLWRIEYMYGDVVLNA